MDEKKSTFTVEYGTPEGQIETFCSDFLDHVIKNFPPADSPRILKTLREKFLDKLASQIDRVKEEKEELNFSLEEVEEKLKRFEELYKEIYDESFNNHNPEIIKKETRSL